MTSTNATTDSQGNVQLPPSFADAKVTVQQVSDTEVVIRKADVEPDEEFSDAQMFLDAREPLRPLSDRDRDAFLKHFEEPPRANEALKALFRKYRDHV